MTTRPASPRQLARASAVLLTALAAATAPTAHAAAFTLEASDASGSSSFTNPLTNGGTSPFAAGWTDGTLIDQAPSSGNTYSTGAFTLRTPTTGDHTFAGDSLTVATGGQLAIKGAANSTVTVNNLILDGGQINVASGTASGTQVFAVAGNITVNSGGGLLRAFNNGTSNQVLNITSVIGGSGTLNVYNDASTNDSRGTIRLSAANTFTGEFKITSNPRSITLGAVQINHLDALKFATLTAEDSNSTQPSVTFVAGAGTYNIGALQGSVANGNLLTASGIALSVGANNTSTSFAGVIAGAGSLAKVGTGSLTLSGTNSYTGTTTVTGGTLALGASNVLADTTALKLNGGTFSVGAGFSDTLSTLDLDASSSLALGSGSSLIFAASNGQDWGASTLSISGSFLSGISLNFGSATGLSSGQLGQISIPGFTSLALDTNGFLTASAVPEPSSFAALAGLGILGFSVTRRRRA